MARHYRYPEFEIRLFEVVEKLWWRRLNWDARELRAASVGSIVELRDHLRSLKARRISLRCRSKPHKTARISKGNREADVRSWIVDHHRYAAGFSGSI